MFTVVPSKGPAYSHVIKSKYNPTKLSFFKALWLKITGKLSARDRAIRWIMRKKPYFVFIAGPDGKQRIKYL